MIKTFMLLTALAIVQARPNEDGVDTNLRLYEIHEDCPAAEVHFLLPHEYDCTKFYYCEYGLKYIEPSDCAPGTEFNAEEQVCVHPRDSGCTLPGPGSTAVPTVAPTGAPTATPTAASTAAPTAGSTAAPTVAPTTAPTAAPTADPTAAPTSGPGPVSTANPDDCEIFDNGCPVDFTIHKLIPHEEYCHLFYYCDKGELVLKSCAEPLYFNPVSEICVWSWETDCVNDGPYTYPTTAAPEITTTPDIGDVLDNGCPADFNIPHLLPHEECEKYYQCNFGQKLERDCQPGTVFNIDAQACDWPFNVPGCEGSPGATARPPIIPDSSEELPLPSDPDSWEALPNGCPADSSIHHLLPHESDCDKYYACDNGILFEMGCAPGTHFSPSQQTCMWPNEAGCEHWTGPGGCGTAPDDNGSDCTGSSTAAPSVAPEVTTTAAPQTTANPGMTGPPDSSEEIPLPDDPELPEEWEPLPNGCPSEFDIDYLLPHEYDCEKFYYCVHGEKVEFDCAPIGTHFSPALQKCVWPHEAGCENRDTSPPGSSTSSAPVTVTSAPQTTPSIAPENTTPAAISTTADPLCPECPTDPAERCKEGCNVAPWPHPECDKYYSCIGDEFRLNICAEGLHFNPSKLSCDFICNAGCVRKIPQITRHVDGLLMFVPDSFNNKDHVMNLIEHELTAEL